jgi:hypothetical protein
MRRRSGVLVSHALGWAVPSRSKLVVSSVRRTTRERESMILITTYKVKPFLSKAETKKVLEVFAKDGPGPGTTAHYVASDNSHGVVIS